MPRRAILVLLLIVAALGMGVPPAPGQPAAPVGRVGHGTRVFDVRDYGALVGSGNAALTRRSIQAAVDAAAEDFQNHTVFIPSGDWYVDRPLMLDRWIDLVGDPGTGTRIIGTGEFSPILVGVSRAGRRRAQPLERNALYGASGSTFKGLYLDGQAYAADLAIGPATNQIRSAARPFTTADVGRRLAITGGTGFTAGGYTIGTVSGGTATLVDAIFGSPVVVGTVGSTAGAWTWGAEHAYIWCSPFSHGKAPAANGNKVDAYGPNGTDEVTIEWQQDVGTTAIRPGPIMGLSCQGGPSGYVVLPWALAFQGDPANQITVYHALADGTNYGQQGSSVFTLPGGLTGKVDFAVTLSARQGKVVAWANGLQLTLAAASNSPAPGAKLQENPGVGFQIAADLERFWVTSQIGGGSPSYATTAGPAGATSFTSLNRNITGLRYWAGAPYDLTRTAGAAQARLDAAPLDPGSVAGARYQTQEPGVIAWIPFGNGFYGDAPADVLANRMFTVVFGNGISATRSLCGFLAPTTFSGNDTVLGSLRNLTVQAMGASYAPAVGLGWLGDYTIADCTVYGGAYGIGMIPSDSTYSLKLDGLNCINAVDIGLYTWFTDLQQTGKLEFQGYGRACFRSDLRSHSTFQHIYVTSLSTQSKYLIDAAYYLRINKATVDIEGVNPAIGAVVRNRSIASAPGGLRCLIDTLDVGALPLNASAIFLDTVDNDEESGRFRLDGFASDSSTFRAVVEVNGRCPIGEFSETQDGIVAPWVLNSTADGLGNVKAIQRPNTFLRAGTFMRDSSVLEPRHPVDGQFTRWRCFQPGAYSLAPVSGAGKPPGWMGLDPLDVAGTGLATYIQANLAWSGPNTSPITAPISQFAASQFLDGYFGVGQLRFDTAFGWKTGLPAGVPTAPAVVASLVTNQEGPTDFYTIWGEGNYARQSPVFSASANGVITNSATITFPGVASPGGPITGIAFLDPTNGVAVGVAPVTPFTPTANQAVTFAPGSIRLQAVPVPAGGTLAPQMGYVGTQVLDAFNNYYLRGIAYTPPTGLQFALSTAPASRSAPTEPSGNGYARVSAGNFALAPPSQPFHPTSAVTPGSTSNAAAVMFPAPTGAWGSIRSIYLLDGSGNVIASGNLTIPRTFAAGQVPTVAAGAFLIHF